MADTEIFNLNQVVDLSTLQDIQDKFAKVVGLSSVIVDEDGVPYGTPSNFTKFCLLIRSSKEGRRRCFKSDGESGNLAMKAGKPLIYNCHSGLIDLASPIIVNNKYMGCMLCGQVLSDDFENKKRVDFKRLSKELSLDEDKLREAYSELNTLKYEKIKDASEFLFLFTNLITKMGMANITQTALLEEIQQKMKLTELIKNMELKSLQSQINPHFLFNTLNAIARIALIENAPNTEELIYSLSDILRYSVKNIDKMVTVKEEIDNIKKYLHIQQTRYGDRMSSSIIIDNNILKYKLPAMTLQPIVENSIIHGLKDKKENGQIKIIGRLSKNKTIIFEIYDNGIGIDNEKIYRLLDIYSEDSGLKGLGIYNVNSRIKHLFGSEFGISIESVKNQYTRVLINIPCSK
ncbi:PocR ligand-binding domain-containing protein [Clostridium sp. JN-9]|uniref:sensor histidine kinase n=1 Tax=Clostridium sp. JN-9 TaxID=2507159 RepID=UPI000FFE1ABB|nr:PocR ligand-binding domain-containing protein [Clostridium sp. JN-9]QAT40391.1 histidine kinase [Clostridium sp. JN-9]